MNIRNYTCYLLVLSVVFNQILETYTSLDGCSSQYGCKLFKST